MSSDVVLTAALRNNLLSLQNTQRSIDTTQLRLATGRKVNSALDGPQAYFAAQGLNNRAADLNRLLDSIGQSIQTIKAADNGVTALTDLVNQADSIASSARDALAAGQSEAKVTGSVDLRNIDDITTLAGFSSSSATLTITIGDPSDPSTPKVAAFSITIATGETIESLVTDINNIRPDDTTDTNKVIEASLNDKGQLEIKTLGGENLSISFAGGGTPQGVAASLGFSGSTYTNNDGTELTASAGAVLTSFALYDGNTLTLSNPEIAHRTSLWTDLEDVNGTALFTGATTLTLTINNKTLTLDLTGTIQASVDKINASGGALSELIQADYDVDTGAFTIKAIDASVTAVNFELAGGIANFGFTGAELNGVNTAENVNFGAAAADIAQLEDNYNSVRDQIDALIQDTGYRGTNLLNGDDLTTFFNEYRTSSLTTSGTTFSASGLGLDAANFSTTATVDSQLTQTREALTTVRNFGTTLASDLAVIQTRQDFTSNLINTLTAGADALVNADQNEEGAKLLALQTRQSLGVTSLSLASQSQQSILRLF
jgi:flagellin-like hook-associated protein FlgL